MTVTFTLQNIPRGSFDSTDANGNPVFDLDDTMGLASGDYVLLEADLGGAGTDRARRVLDVTGSLVTLDGLLTPIGGAVFFFFPPFRNTWAYVETTTNGEGGTWLHMDSLGGGSVESISSTSARVNDYDVDETLIDGESTSGTDLAATLDTDACTIYFGLIPADVRRYFDLDSPSKSKRVKEAWATMTGVTDHHCHIYEEFDTTLVPGNSFTMGNALKPRDNSASSKWIKKTEIPSSLLTAFGFQISERGADEFKLLNYVLKYDADA